MFNKAIPRYKFGLERKQLLKQLIIKCMHQIDINKTMLCVCITLYGVFCSDSLRWDYLTVTPDMCDLCGAGYIYEHWITEV